MPLALEKFRSAVAVDPTFASASQKHAMALHELGRLDEARTEILESLSYEKNLESLEILGRIESGRKNLPGLKAAFGQLDSAGYPDGNIFNTFGIFFAEAGDLDSAAAAFSKALELDPADSNARKNLALARLEAGHSSEAVELLREVSEKDPADGFIAYSLAKQLARSGDYAGAVVSLQRAVASSEPSPEWIGALAWIYATHPQDSLRDGKAALELASRAVDLAGEKEPTALVVLAAAQAENGHFSSAVETARKAMTVVDPQTDSATHTALKIQLEFYENGKPFRDSGMSSSPGDAP
jgi:Flp pilus assembly protein TadD